MARALIVDINFIKENTEIDENVDVKLINPTIWYVQKQYIEKVLGTTLYNELCDAIIDDHTLVTYPDLLNLTNNYIADAMLFWVMHEAQVPLLYKFRNKSVGKNTDPNTQPVDFEQHKYLKDEYKKKAQYFTERLKDYLCANTDLYPNYLISTENDDIIPTSIPPQVSVYLGGKKLPRLINGTYCWE